MLIGNGVALGLECHYKQQRNWPTSDPFKTASTYVVNNYVKESDKSLKGVQELVRVGIELGMDTSLGLTEVLAVEQFLGGRIKPDLIGRYYDGSLVVIDHKVKTNLDDRYLERELLSYDTSNQFFQYGYFVAKEYGEPVSTVFAHMIVVAPVPKTYLHPVTMSQERLDFWLQGVIPTWDLMKAIEEGGPREARFSSCQGRYGPCDMAPGCHTLHGDESTFNLFYDAI